MAKPGNKGRVPTSSKEDFDSFTDEDMDFNMLQLDSELRKELDDKGLVPRWINASKYMNGGNFHRSGWRAYRRESSAGDVRGGMDFALGTSPEGYIIRNDLMLAVKQKEAHAKWGARIRHMTKLQSGTESTRAADLRDLARKSGTSGITVHEGYDANGEDTED